MFWSATNYNRFHFSIFPKAMEKHFQFPWQLEKSCVVVNDFASIFEDHSTLNFLYWPQLCSTSASISHFTLICLLAKTQRRAFSFAIVDRSFLQSRKSPRTRKNIHINWCNLTENWLNIFCLGLMVLLCAFLCSLICPLFSLFICLQPLQRTVIDSIRFIKKEQVWSIPIIEIDFSSNHIFLLFLAFWSPESWLRITSPTSNDKIQSKLTLNWSLNFMLSLAHAVS